MSKNKSIAHSVVKQALAQNKKTENVICFDKVLTFHNRVEYGKDSEGKSTIIAFFANSKTKKMSTLDISFLTEFPNLEKPLSTALLKWGEGVSHTSRCSIFSAFKTHFLGFIKKSELCNAELKDLDEYFFLNYKNYLHAHRTTAGTSLSPATLRFQKNILSPIFLGLVATQWHDHVDRILNVLPKAPANSHKSNTPTETLDILHLHQIIEAAEAEAAAIINLWRERPNIIKQGETELANGCKDYDASFALCLAEMHNIFENKYAQQPEIAKKNKALARAIQFIHTSTAINKYRFISARDIVPFIILITVLTAFNSDTVLALKWNGIELVDRAGLPAWKLTGYKGRAHADLTALIDSTKKSSSGIGLSDLIWALKTFIGQLDVSSYTEKSVFVYMSSHGNVKTFITSEDINKSSATWSYQLRRFCKDNNIKEFCLSELRQTIIDNATFMSGDLSTGQAIGSHLDKWTTLTHYTSDLTRKQFSEQIGTALILRERWLDTDGKIDPRVTNNVGLHIAATPGFLCLDPYDSPIKNQKKSTTCKAYGECPGCPLAAANISTAKNVAMYLALRESIYKSQGSMSSQTWLGRWAPILNDLNLLINRIPDSILKSASVFKINLPMVG